MLGLLTVFCEWLGKRAAEPARLGSRADIKDWVLERRKLVRHKTVLHDLQLLRKKFELIGSYPDLVAQAQMWDGKSDVDPVGYYLENARKERIEAKLEGEMTAEEYLEEQARKAAAESVPGLFRDGMSMEMEKRELKPNQVKVKNKAIVTFIDGVVRNAHARVLRSDGREEWARFPEIPELKEAGFPAGDVYMPVGDASYGYIHVAFRHAAEFAELYPGTTIAESIECFIDDVFRNLKKARGSYVGKGKKKKVDGDTEVYEKTNGKKRKREYQ